MKKIVLMPVKNESWILNFTLNSLSKNFDHIIIADQSSTDGSIDICKSFSNVDLIHNPEKYHSNKIRGTLLNAAREYDGENLIFCIDADEMLPTNLFANQFEQYLGLAKPGEAFSFHWIQMWKSITQYRNDKSIWANSWKSIAFWDNRKLNYPTNYIINDHTSRIPLLDPVKEIKVNSIPLLHFQWVSWERVEIKQAWYCCSELINAPNSANEINNKYRQSLVDDSKTLTDIPLAWIEGLNIPANLETAEADWHLYEIYKWFDDYGVLFFEDLNIWHIETLRNFFYNKTFKYPRVKLEKEIITRLNNFINNFKFK
jgi:hypothetical protein